jgi:predicted CXXCH cytochrome family protein
MYSVGVRCSDCHEPHTAKLRAEGNALCVNCHGESNSSVPAHVDGSGLHAVNYDSPAHHHHAAGKPGSQCVDCHAPARKYMVIDPRRDHSFRVPRPDVSVAIGTPNACGGCHADKPAQWAADAVAQWYGPGRRQEPHYGLALDAGRHGKPGAVAGLIALAGDTAKPAIARATALELLARYPGRAALQASQGGLRDADPLVRLAAMGAQEQLAAPQRSAALAPLLDDPVRAVRSEAARQLAPVATSLTAERRTSFDTALVEYVAAQNENADRPESPTNLGNSYLARGDVARAEELYRRAIHLDAGYVPAYVNLADLYRGAGRDGDAERVLREGLRAVANAPALRGALGLLLVRQGKNDEALVELAAAAQAAPDDAWHSYVYAVALHDAGRPQEALERLRAAAARRGDRDVLLALASYEREAGNLAAAEKAVRDLAAINPNDPALAR